MAATQSSVLIRIPNRGLPLQTPTHFSSPKMTVFSLNKVFFFSLNKQNERKKKKTGFKWTFMYGSTDMPQEVTLGTEQKTEYGSVLIPKHHSFRSLTHF